MSQFLPETGAGAPQTDSVGSLLTPATLDISAGDIALMQKVLSAAARNPNLIPSDFMAYIVDYIQTSRLSIPIGQVFGFTQTKTIVGEVNADGTIASGTGFTVSKTGTGVYAVAFSSPLSAPAIVIGNALSPNQQYTAIASTTTSGFTVHTWDQGVGAANIAFVFSAQPQPT